MTKAVAAISKKTPKLLVFASARKRLFHLLLRELAMRAGLVLSVSDLGRVRQNNLSLSTSVAFACLLVF